MEKYTKWRDAGTGIAPFLPVQVPDVSVGLIPLRLVLAMLKLLLLMVSLLLLLVADTFGSFALGSVSRSASDNLRACTARLVLYSAGFFTLTTTYESRRYSSPRGGEVVVVNRSSPVDILILVWLYPSALFTRTGADMLFEAQSMFNALYSSFVIQYTKTGLPLEELRKTYRSRVIIVFPECTTSNNRGILSFCPFMIEKAHVMSIKYNNPPYLTTPIPGAFWTFLWALISLPKHVCRLKGSGKGLEGDYADALARYARIPRTQLSIEDKEGFINSWRRR